MCFRRLSICAVFLDILQKNTNVIELYNLILKEEENNQHTWYNSGIGTYARPSWKSLKYYRKVLYHKIDLAIAWYVDRSLTTPQSYDLIHSGILSEPFWLRIAGCRTITSLVIVYFYSLCLGISTALQSILKDKFRVLSWRVSGSRAFSNDRQGEMRSICSPLNLCL